MQWLRRTLGSVFICAGGVVIGATGLDGLKWWVACLLLFFVGNIVLPGAVGIVQKKEDVR